LIRRARIRAPCGVAAAPGSVAVERRRPGKRRREGRGAGAIAGAENLHSTTIPPQMARPVELCMKSMRYTTGLGSGAGVVVLRRFPVTLSTQSRGLGQDPVDDGPARPAGALTHPLSLPRFTEPPANPSRPAPQLPRGPRVNCLAASQVVGRRSRPMDGRQQRGVGAHERCPFLGDQTTVPVAPLFHPTIRVIHRQRALLGR
jgi:hypothetical protein